MPKFNYFFQRYFLQLFNKEVKIRLLWKDIFNHLRDSGRIDLANIWTNEVKRDFKKIRKEDEALIFIFERLHSHYNTDNLRYTKEISDTRKLIKHLKKIKATKKYVLQMYNDLKNIILDIEEEKRKMLEEVRIRMVMRRSLEERKEERTSEVQIGLGEKKQLKTPTIEEERKKLLLGWGFDSDISKVHPDLGNILLSQWADTLNLKDIADRNGILMDLFRYGLPNCEKLIIKYGLPEVGTILIQLSNELKKYKGFFLRMGLGSSKDFINSKKDLEAFVSYYKSLCQSNAYDLMRYFMIGLGMSKIRLKNLSDFDNLFNIAKAWWETFEESDYAAEIIQYGLGKIKAPDIKGVVDINNVDLDTIEKNKIPIHESQEKYADISFDAIALGGELAGYLIKIVYKEAFEYWNKVIQLRIPCEEILRYYRERHGRIAVITRYYGRSSGHFSRLYPQFKEEVFQQYLKIASQLQENGLNPKSQSIPIIQNYCCVEIINESPIVRLCNLVEIYDGYISDKYSERVLRSAH